MYILDYKLVYNIRVYIDMIRYILDYKLVYNIGGYINMMW